VYVCTYVCVIVKLTEMRSLLSLTFSNHSQNQTQIRLRVSEMDNYSRERVYTWASAVINEAEASKLRQDEIDGEALLEAFQANEQNFKCIFNAMGISYGNALKLRRAYRRDFPG
jgi:hypothetical protein